MSEGRLEGSGGKRAGTGRKGLSPDPKNPKYHCGVGKGKQVHGDQSGCNTVADVVIMASQGLLIGVLDSNPLGILTLNCPV